MVRHKCVERQSALVRHKLGLGLCSMAALRSFMISSSETAATFVVIGPLNVSRLSSGLASGEFSAEAVES